MILFRGLRKYYIERQLDYVSIVKLAISTIKEIIPISDDILLESFHFCAIWLTMFHFSLKTNFCVQSDEC